MKKIVFGLLLMLFFSLESLAGEIPHTNYKNIKLKSKISYDSGKWYASKKYDTYYTKTNDLAGFAYLDKDGNYAFSTECDYEFIWENRLIGYSNKDFCFYDFSFNDGTLEKQPVSEEEIKTMFPSYKIVKLSQFSPYTNSLKIKKGLGELKILILNDKDVNFEGYYFSSGNAKFRTCPIAGIINISSAGMIQLSHDGENTPETPWYVLLVR